MQRVCHMTRVLCKLRECQSIEVGKKRKKILFGVIQAYGKYCSIVEKLAQKKKFHKLIKIIL
jgi:hypothetical protein